MRNPNQKMVKINDESYVVPEGVYDEFVLLRLHISKLEEDLRKAGDAIIAIFVRALSGDEERYVYYHTSGKKYCRWGVVEKDIREVLK